MNITELIKQLQEIQKTNPDLPVWLGVDPGEGWVKLDKIFVENAKYCGLDGDDMDNEVIYPDDPYTYKEIDKNIYYKSDLKKYIRNGELYEQEKEMIARYRDVLILGEYNSEWYVEYTKKQEQEEIQAVEDFLQQQKENKLKIEDHEYQKYLELKNKFENDETK